MYQPPDFCPYRRPFGDAFDACPAYQAIRFVPLDAQYRPLPAVWTCGHIESTVVSAQRNRMYARCRIGDASARAEWVARRELGNTATLRTLRAEVNALLAADAADLWTAKSEQLRAAPGSRDRDAATARMRAAGGHFLATLDAFLHDRADQLSALGIAQGPTHRIYADFLEAWVNQPSAEVPEITDASLAALPVNVRMFFKFVYEPTATR